MGTYMKSWMWLRVALVPVMLAVVVWGIVSREPLLILAGALLLGSAALSLVGLRMRRDEERRGLHDLS